MTAVSVILPSYNRDHLLDRAISSVTAQTFSDFELIIVDDASTDETCAIVQAYADERIRYLRSEQRRGAAAARNLGINAASGEFIAFLDSDDEWLPEKLQLQVEAFDGLADDVAVVYSARQQSGAPDPTDREKLSGDILERLLVGNFIGTGQVLVRSECLRTVGGFDELLPSAHDWDLWIRLSESYHFRYVDEVVCVYHLQPDSISYNPAAKVLGYRSLGAKHRERLSRLSASLRCEHHYYVGLNLWRIGATTDASKHLVRSAMSSPRAFMRRAVKLLERKIRRRIHSGGRL